MRMRCVLVFALVLALPPLADAESPRRDGRYRSLDTSERAEALSRAREQSRPALAARRAAGAAPREEVLLIEHHREPKGAAGEGRRRADVYIYDYTSDTLSLSVVDLDTGQSEPVRLAQDAQLPLTQAEIERAQALFYAHPMMRARLEDEYQRATGESLTGLSDVHVRGFVFRADSMPETAPRETAACGRHRCAQLMIYTRDKVAMQWLPIVDLSWERVLDSVPFGLSPTERDARETPGTAHGPHEHGGDHAH